MNYPTYGRANRITATGTAVISSANSHIIGVLLACTATGGLIIYHGVTASTTGAVVRGYVTTAATGQISLYYPVPMYCSGGITIRPIQGLDVDITLFWNPAT